MTYSTGEVLSHVPDPEAFIAQIQRDLRERRQRREEFVHSLTPEVKAEWINGEAVYHSPARQAHNMTVHRLQTLLGLFSAPNDAYYVFANKAMLAVLEDRYEPDIAVWSKAKHNFDAEQVIFPPADLVVEVLSRSTSAVDRGVKFRHYALAGIVEYWLIDADEEILEQYVAEEGAYVIRGRWREAEDVESVAMPGFAIPVAALFSQPAFAKTLRQLVVG